MKLALKLMASAITVFLITWQSALAGEGAGSNYLQGTNGDFLMGVFGPAGVYFRNDTFYYDASAGVRPLGGALAGASDTQVLANLSKFIWLTDNEIFGARYGAAVVVPFIHASVSGQASAGGFEAFKEGDRSGLGDITVSPLLLNWTFGNSHITFAPAITAPTGQYDPDYLLNISRHYWSFYVGGAYTWFDPQNGHEISISPGLLFNTENPTTNYHTGTALYVDWLIGQHFSESFAMGVTGYYFRQLQGDSASLPLGIDVNDFKGIGLGIGPAVNFAVPVLGKPVSFTAKALFDISSENSFQGNLFMLSTAFKF